MRARVDGASEKHDSVDDSVLLEWVAHPARRSPGRLVLCLAVIAIATVCAKVGLGSTLLAVIGVVVLVIATAPFLFPTRYRFTTRGVSERRLATHRERRWVDIRRVAAGPGALLLSPYRYPQWLERHRGLIVFFDGAERERVIAIARERAALPAGGAREVSS